MKILHLLFNRVGQADYWRSTHFGRYLVQNGHEVISVVTSISRHASIITREIDGVRLVEMPDLFNGSLRSGWDPWNTLRRLLWLQGQSFDIVHVFGTRPTALFPALYLQRLHHIPLVLDWVDWFGRGGSVEERTNPLVRAILRPPETFFEEHFRTQADASTVICTTLREKTIALGVDPSSILLLHNGSDTERFYPISTEEARLKLGLAVGWFLIGYVGTIFPRDADLMVAAFNRVLEQIPEAHLLIAGNFPFDIRKRINKPERVIQTGFLEDNLLHEYLSACDMFWLPMCDTNANRGRWPLKLNDYMAIGRPTIATAVGDIKDLIESEQIGFLSSDQPGSFAAQTLRLYSDPALGVRMGRCARQLAESTFRWENLTEQLENLYKQVLKPR